MSVYPTPESVVEVFSNLVPQDEEEGSPQEEVENLVRKVPAILNPSDRINRFITLVEVVHQSLVPCLVATPFVYLSDSDWTFASHSDFRGEKRKALNEILTTLRSKVMDMEESELVPLIDKFADILAAVFRVRIPAMPNYYITENFYETVGASEIAEELISSINDAKIFDAKTRLQNLTKVLVRWFLLCPVGRPQVYVDGMLVVQCSNNGWTTTSEKDLRATFRSKLIGAA